MLMRAHLMHEKSPQNCPIKLKAALKAVVNAPSLPSGQPIVMLR